jgi:hypothetical protein
LETSFILSKVVILLVDTKSVTFLTSPNCENDYVTLPKNEGFY